MMDRNAIVDAWRSLSGAARAALGLAAAAIVVLLWVAPSVASSLFAGSLASVTQTEDAGEKDALAYNETVQNNIDFVSQRSPFFAPAPPPPKTTRVDPGPKPDPGPAPPPRTYDGPKIVGLVGSEGALFASPVVGDKQFLAVGQKGGEVELVSVEQPWRAKVRWRGAEFDLNLFDRIELLPANSFGGATPLGGQPTVNLFGNRPKSPASTTSATGDLNFGDAADDSTAGDNN